MPSRPYINNKFSANNCFDSNPFLLLLIQPNKNRRQKVKNGRNVDLIVYINTSTQIRKQVPATILKLNSFNFKCFKMVIINLWFIPRSRSTALLRCLSNIPGSKVFFEKLTFCDFVNNFPHIFEEGKVSDDQPLETYEDVLKGVLNNSSPIKIVKDIAGTLKTDDYPKLMTKESVNIFAFRHPALVETSVITGHAIPYFEVNKRAGFPVKMNEAYEMIKYVKQNCDHEPVVLPGKTFMVHLFRFYFFFSGQEERLVQLFVPHSGWKYFLRVTSYSSSIVRHSFFENVTVNF